jgi:hypothetical protein
MYIHLQCQTRLTEERRERLALEEAAISLKAAAYAIDTLPLPARPAPVKLKNLGSGPSKNSSSAAAGGMHASDWVGEGAGEGEGERVGGNGDVGESGEQAREKGLEEERDVAIACALALEQATISQKSYTK